MNRTEFIREITKNTESEYTQKEVAEILDTAHKVLTATLLTGEKVSFTGFGSFEVAERAERIARNPQSGEEITVPAHKVPKFKFGKAVREAVKNS
jgi:DNA-binding protein HU-beta